MRTLFEIEPEYRAPLEAAGLASFDAMMRAPTAGPPASKHAHRETVPLEICVNGLQRCFFLKRVFKVPPRHAVFPLLQFKSGISQPRHEWNMLGRLAEVGLPAMQRVAIGEERLAGIPRRAFILVEAVPFKHTVEEWLTFGPKHPAWVGGATRSRMVHQLGWLVSWIQDAGFRWPDLSVKHLFAQPSQNEDGKQKWDFMLIDVERMTFNESQAGIEVADKLLPKENVVYSELRQLFKSVLSSSMRRRDILLFWAGYNANPRRTLRKQGIVTPFPIPDLPWLSADLSLPRLPDDHSYARGARLTKEDGIVTSDSFRALLAGSGIQSMGDLFAPATGVLLSKPGLAPHRDRVRMEFREPNARLRIGFLKRYRQPPLREQLRRIREHDRRDSSAKREAHFIKHLSLIGIPTMRTLAWGQEMSGPWESRSFIITEEILGESLEKLAIRSANDPSATPSALERYEIIRQLALIVRHMHGFLYFHRDLYLCHVFLTRNSDGGIVLRLIDLARMIHKPVARQRWVTKDLAALDYSSPSPLVTRADRIRFLYHYLGGVESVERKHLIRETIRQVGQRVAKMARHDASRRRKFSERPTA